MAEREHAPLYVQRSLSRLECREQTLSEKKGRILGLAQKADNDRATSANIEVAQLLKGHALTMRGNTHSSEPEKTGGTIRRVGRNY